MAGLLTCNPAFARLTCIPSIVLVGHINSTAIKYKIPRDLLFAISSVESCHGRYRYNAKTHDYGVMQVNQHTAKAMGLDAHRLLTDDLYSLNAAARLLVELRSSYPADWECRYNVGTARTSRVASLCKLYLSRLHQAGYKPK